MWSIGDAAVFGTQEDRLRNWAHEMVRAFAEDSQYLGYDRQQSRYSTWLYGLMDFTVGARPVGVAVDHALLTFSVLFQYSIAQTSRGISQTRYSFTPEANSVYTEEIYSRLCTAGPGLSVEECTTLLTETLHGAALEAYPHTQLGRRQHSGSMPQNSWYDEECRETRAQLQRDLLLGVITYRQSRITSRDTFNENEPSTNDTSYIASLGAAVYDAMQAGDDKAIWLMQGWLFATDSSFWQPSQMQALLHSVPAGKMVVLDLFAEVKPVWNRSNHFYETPYIWCMLHNFGGNIEMYGTLDTLASGPIKARNSPNSTMVGVGMCMEGIEQNPVVYELMAEMAFHMDKVDVPEWVTMYSSRRYGGPNIDAQRAWETLHRSIYNCEDKIADHNTDVIVKFLDVNASDFELTGVPGHQWYASKDAVGALEDLLQVSGHFGNLSTYRYDVADLTRQVLAKTANRLYYEIMLAYRGGDLEELRTNSKTLLELISDIEQLLASDECFLLGNWLESAKALATSRHLSAKDYIMGARPVGVAVDCALFTLSVSFQYSTGYTSGDRSHTRYTFTPETDSVCTEEIYSRLCTAGPGLSVQCTTLLIETLHGAASEALGACPKIVANKYWSGLVGDYYLPRMALYLGLLEESLKGNVTFPYIKLQKQWISLTNAWQSSTKVYPTITSGDTIKIAEALFQKYIKPNSSLRRRRLDLSREQLRGYS
ncbi:hypothetical protein L7F22_035222 [Adiantum nelumboides]|nr:hypothetical protein [Adiantum nelumboides]